MDAHMDKIKSLSYMKLLGNRVNRCNHKPELKFTRNILETKVLEKIDTNSKRPKHQGLDDVDKEMSTDQPHSTHSTVNAMESLKENNIEPQIIENLEKVPTGSPMTTFKCQMSPPIKSKFFESSTSSDSEDEDDENEDDNSSYNDSWDDSDSDEEDNSIMASHDFTSTHQGMDEYDSSGLGFELSDEEDENDEDILFCDNIELCTPLKVSIQQLLQFFYTN